jgi:hypothetical protein
LPTRKAPADWRGGAAAHRQGRSAMVWAFPDFA